MSCATVDLTVRQYLELQNLATGAFAPLAGFMDETTFASVVARMRLPDGRIFPLPIVLDLREAQDAATRHADRLDLMFHGEAVGEVQVTSRFRCDKLAVAAQVYGTRDPRHPGVAHFLRMGDRFVGGPVRLTGRRLPGGSADELTPAETRAFFAARGWATIVGFQTRNIPHRAHEYLLRLALEVAEGLFIQPLVGWKKAGDCSPEAIFTAYRTLIDGFLQRDRILLGRLSTSMRYAGPREAVFHAMIRRNYGCTHFIVGRDHAGVSNYYGRYQAQALARELEGELGIVILPFGGPYYCSRCDGIVTERTCPHRDSAPDAITEISGTAVRDALSAGAGHAAWVRREVLESMRALTVLIEEDDE